MRSSFVSALSAFVLSLSASTTIGCAAHNDDAEAADVGEMTQTLLSNVGAFDLAELGAASPIAAPAKVKKLLGGLRSPREGRLRCLPKKQIAIHGKDGETMASIKLGCDNATTGKVEAQLDVERPDGLSTSASATSYVVKVDLATFEAVIAAPVALGDLLYGVDELKLGRMGLDPVTISDAETLGVALDAFGLDAPLEEGALRCLPEISATLSDGRKIIGTISTCGTEATLSLNDETKSATTFGGIDTKALNAIVNGKGAKTK